MRPQHITAENAPAPQRRRTCTTGFNEAAAYHCGKPAGRAAEEESPLASMRPQHITAENPGATRDQMRYALCFNEAAAYHCGKRAPEDAQAPAGGDASMRPQHITAENGGGSHAATAVADALQ